MLTNGLFIGGPISMNQAIEFGKYGINAVKIFWYIRWQEGIMVSRKQLSENEHTFIKIPNKTLEQLFGVRRSIKWDKLRTLEVKGLFELKINRQGIASETKNIDSKITLIFRSTPPTITGVTNTCRKLAVVSIKISCLLVIKLFEKVFNPTKRLLDVTSFHLE
jgi:hypothetical protein